MAGLDLFTGSVFERLTKSYLSGFKLGAENGNQETFENPAKRQQFKDQFLKLCELEESFKSESDLIANFQCNSIDDFDREYANACKAMKQQTSTQQLTNVQLPRYLKFSNDLDNIIVGSFSETQQQAEDNEDFQMEDQDLSLIDPFSKQQILDPVRNSICNHLYDRKSVMDAVLLNKRTRCAYVGCSNRQPITPLNLISDDILKARLDRKQTQQEVNLDDDDDDHE